MGKCRIICAISALLLIMSNSCEPTEAKVTRAPTHAGAFYPGDAAKIKQAISGYLSAAGTRGFAPPAVAKQPPQANSDSPTVAKQPPRALIVPHAGYDYSGRTAACGYRLWMEAAGKIDRVILMAPSHYAALGGIVVNERNYSTPLGVYRLDARAVEALLKAGCPNEKNPVAETGEHADEVQVPFLQTVLPKAKLVPLIVGDLSDPDLEAAARALAAIVDDRTVIVASSDFTHYGPRFGYMPAFRGDVGAGIKGIDMGAADLIVKGDLAGFSRYLERTGATICGRNPIRLLLKLFEVKGLAVQGRLLCYATSGEMTGDFNNSVSYASIALGALGTPGAQGAVEEEGRAGGGLSEAEGRTLTRLARHVLEKFVRDGASEYPDPALAKFDITGALKGNRGVFVTLKKNGDLRGCIGHIIPRVPLYRGVIENAMNAAARDPRFQPVEAGELGSIRIEISVMSPLVRAAGASEIVVGRDGVVLVNGQHTGVFLPQVPGEQGWDRTTYLERLGEKAGMDRGAYKLKDTELYRFTAQIFEE